MEFQDTVPLDHEAAATRGPSPRPTDNHGAAPTSAARTTPHSAPPSPLEPAASGRTGPHALAVQFTGTGSEYFRIWIVNLLLTLVTLGFYYPFAKARRLRYFHGNTLVGGHALGFHGDPWKMLRGYVLMLAFGAAYAGAGHFSAVAGVVAALLFAGLWPALWQASLRFRLANTSWRGLRFRFSGSLRGAYATLLPLLLPFVLLVLAKAMDADAAAGGEVFDEIDSRRVVMNITVGLAALVIVALAPWLLARLKRYQHGHYQFANETTRLDASTRAFYALMGRTIGVSLIPLALIAGGFGIIFAGAFSGSAGATIGASLLAMPMILAGYLLLLVLTQSYAVARLQNLVWSSTRSHRIRISSGLKVRQLLGTHLVNLLLTVVTFGLYRPFAAIAVAKLRLEAVSLEAHGDVDQWTADAAARANDATGDAAGDLFGIDVGL